VGHRSKDQPNDKTPQQKPAKRLHTAAKKKQQVIETATKTSQQAGQRSEDQPKGGTPQKRTADRRHTAAKTSHKVARRIIDHLKCETPQR
jgi:hypothetical protein